VFATPLSIEDVIRCFFSLESSFRSTPFPPGRKNWRFSHRFTTSWSSAETLS